MLSKLASKLRAFLGLPSAVGVPSAIQALINVSEEGPTKTSLSNVLNLSIHSAAPNGDKDLISAKQSAHLCVEQQERIRSYSSYTLVRNKARKSLRGRDFVYLAWRLDFVRPDDFHVRQAYLLDDLSDVLLDEWITLGKEHYWFGPNWLRADDALNHRPHHVLLAEKYLDLLKNEGPLSAQQFQYLDLPYLLLKYRVTELLQDFSGIGFSAKGVVDVGIWIDSSTNLLAKAVIESEDQSEFEQVFAAYNEVVVVKQPHIGMQPTPGKPENYTVTDTRRIPSAFHN